KVPGLFVACAPAFRSRHSLERRDPNAPLAEPAYARASEARFSGFESRVGYQFFSRERELAPLFYNLDVAKRPRRAQRALGLPMGRAAGAAGLRPRSMQA